MVGGEWSCEGLSEAGETGRKQMIVMKEGV